MTMGCKGLIQVLLTMALGVVVMLGAGVLFLFDASDRKMQEVTCKTAAYGQFRARVVDFDTGQPIPDAKIYLPVYREEAQRCLGLSEIAPSVYVSDANGQFVLDMGFGFPNPIRIEAAGCDPIMVSMGSEWDVPFSETPRPTSTAISHDEGGRIFRMKC